MPPAQFICAAMQHVMKFILILFIFRTAPLTWILKEIREYKIFLKNKGEVTLNIYDFNSVLLLTNMVYIYKYPELT